MNASTIRKKLIEAGIEYTETDFMSNGFWGKRFTFEPKMRRKVNALLGDTIVQAYYNQLCIVTYG